MNLVATDDDVSEYLKEIKKCIKKDKNNLKLQQNRQNNFEFMVEYNLNKNVIIDIINQLELNDFIDKVANRHEEYKDEVLYIFNKNYELTNTHGNKKLVSIYIKFNYINPKVILVSFHEAKYRFKEK